MHPTSFLGLLLICLMTLIPTYAKANYVIEMLIFEPTSTQGWLDEYWPLLPTKLDTQEKENILGNSTSSHRLIGDGQNALKESEKRLISTGEYRILSRSTWSQPAEERSNAYTTVLPEGISSTGLPLQAKVKLYKQKFEHLDLEVQLERQIPKGIIPDFAQKHKLSLTDVGNTWRFRLQESRKIKPGEIQYFDHPMFGVLLMVRDLGVQ